MKKLFFLSVLMLLPLLASADAVEINGIYYDLIEKAGQAEVTRNPKYYTGSVVIPESVVNEGKKYSVTSIGNYAFSYCSGLTSVTISNSVTTIGQEAFSSCSSLTSITIPNSVTSIGSHAFLSCSGLTSVHIIDIAAWCNISFSNFGSNPLSFAHHLYLNGEEVKDLVIPNSVTSIDSYAFSGCSGLTTVTIPNSVTSISEQAFSNCSGLIVVTIPNSVTFIGNAAFANCSGLTSVIIPNSVTSIGSSVFSGCSGLTSVTIPNNVTFISNYAFMDCSGLTSVSIPNSVTSIGDKAFNGCIGLTSMIIPNSVTSIGELAFSSCSDLTSVTIGSGVKRIYEKAFAECKELKEVYCLAENVPNTYYNSFEDSYINYATLHVPAPSVNAYKAAIPWKNFKSIVALDGETPETKKCATPTISYQFGQLSFSCETEGVTFVSEITDYDIKKSYDASLYLTATYYISVYATKDGYENSDIATATLSWMDAELYTDDISGGAATVRAKAVLIQSNGSTLSIAGADEGTAISVYDVSGKMVGSATVASENTHISTSLRSGDIGLVKIGSKTIKVVLK